MILKFIGGAVATAILFAFVSAFLMLCIWWSHKYR